ncbi:hypothetical protein M0812_21922 [Anaeramoeba flamelloides]|uniref:Uncharacterized protein n=1 Tax=Anaeramoeba flamelloides TaxID=1746091 RepID=A0AAV7YX36_9EUKA|nr:hypothetical protein M0812_21922 [Anaeramoeba flamelloides]
MTKTNNKEKEKAFLAYPMKRTNSGSQNNFYFLKIIFVFLLFYQFFLLVEMNEQFHQKNNTTNLNQTQIIKKQKNLHESLVKILSRTINKNNLQNSLGSNRQIEETLDRKRKFTNINNYASTELQEPYPTIPFLWERVPQMGKIVFGTRFLPTKTPIDRK